ncbi:MAG TPA: phosphate ABC transporter permease PstA [Thermoleophilia bacterium]|nr:phosphate ABC transporter permease PstA [Thermoleophilia bacterium]
MSTSTPQKSASSSAPISLSSRRGWRHRARDGAFRGAVTGSVVVGLVVLVALILQSLIKGWPRLNLDLITSFPSSFPDRAGIQSAIFGTFWMVGIVLVVAIPIGVGAAVYMEEFADSEAWYNRFIDLIIQNLAAVPSIVYGILGLAFLSRGLLNLGPVVITAGLTLSFLVLPVVIIASREAIRAVPSSILDGALALGATRWQGVSRQVLPASIPGIATGSILAVSRAIGEAAPLLLLGALQFITFNPTGLDSSFTALPIQIFNWISRPQEGFHIAAAAAIIVLLCITLLMNAVAIWLRNRFQQTW